MYDTMIVQWATAPRENEDLIGEACKFLRRSNPHGFSVVQLADGSEVLVHPENTLALEVGSVLQTTKLTAERCEDIYRQFGMPGDMRGGVRAGMTAEEIKEVDRLWAKMDGHSCWWDAFQIIRLATTRKVPALREVVYEGMHTPWGSAQGATVLAPGIGMVTTAGHGGIKLSEARNQQIPSYMRRDGGWYEEDCEWAIPAVVFEKELSLANHWETFRGWFPDEYERFTGKQLQPGESHERDRRNWMQRHEFDLIVVSALSNGDGTVKVAACVGGRNERGQYSGPLSYWVVPGAEYEARNPHGFVVDPKRHEQGAAW